MASWFEDRKEEPWKKDCDNVRDRIREREKREKGGGERKREKERRLSEKQKRTDRIERVARAKEGL